MIAGKPVRKTFFEKILVWDWSVLVLVPKIGSTPQGELVDRFFLFKLTVKDPIILCLQMLFGWNHFQFYLWYKDTLMVAHIIEVQCISTPNFQGCSVFAAKSPDVSLVKNSKTQILHFFNAECLPKSYYNLTFAFTVDLKLWASFDPPFFFATLHSALLCMGLLLSQIKSYINFTR